MAKLKQNIELPEKPNTPVTQEKEDIGESEQASENIDTKVSDEILFLERLYRVQNDGGFGTHLNDMINERLTQLKSK